MKQIVIEPSEIEITRHHQIRRCLIKRYNNDKLINQSELWFKFSKSIPLPEDADCESYLLGVIMDAMAENRDIIIKGQVSKQLLSNLVEYQSAWHKWLPHIYSCINITVDTIKNDNVSADGAICAFSGGVDATFSVWRHTRKLCSHRSQEIKLCAIVHGFDIPLNDETAFENARKTAEKTLDDIHVKLEPITTNYRQISKASWEHACACALASALCNFKTVTGTGIIGSSEPYDSLVIPWGSSPITDHLLSSSAFNIIHDGAGYNRTEKIKEISSWSTGVNHLRVCWQGDLKDKNCGQCEKCVRTKFNFLAAGEPVPACFPDSNITEDLSKISLVSEVALAEWRQLYKYAQTNNIELPCAERLSKITKCIQPRKVSIRKRIKNKIKKYLRP